MAISDKNSLTPYQTGVATINLNTQIGDEYAILETS